jgi:hypothetical protein
MHCVDECDEMEKTITAKTQADLFLARFQAASQSITISVRMPTGVPPNLDLVCFDSGKLDNSCSLLFPRSTTSADSFEDLLLTVFGYIIEQSNAKKEGMTISSIS